MTRSQYTKCLSMSSSKSAPGHSCACHEPTQTVRLQDTLEVPEPPLLPPPHNSQKYAEPPGLLRQPPPILFMEASTGTRSLREPQRPISRRPRLTAAHLRPAMANQGQPVPTRTLVGLCLGTVASKKKHPTRRHAWRYHTPTCWPILHLLIRHSLTKIALVNVNRTTMSTQSTKMLVAL